MLGVLCLGLCWWGGETGLEIKERSGVVLEVDGRVVDATFHDVSDAWEKAVNHILNKCARKAVIKETITIEKK